MTGRANPVNDIFNARTQLSEVFFRRIATGYAHLFPLTARRVIEFGFLLQAFFVLCVLIYLHYMFVRSPITCLDKLRSHSGGLELVDFAPSEQLERNHYAPGRPNTPNEPWPRYGILRVEVIRQAKPSYSLEDSYAKEFLGTVMEDTNESEETDESSSKSSFTTASPHNLQSTRHKTLLFDTKPLWNAIRSFSLYVCRYYRESYELLLNWFSIPFGSAETVPVSSVWNWKYGIFFDTISYIGACISSALVQFCRELTSWFHSLHATPHEENYIVEYALEYGFLRLSPAMRKRLNITVKLVVLDPDVDACFGGPLSRFLMDEFLGYDDLLLGSIKHLAVSDSVRGHMANVVTGQHYRLVSSQMSRSSYLVAVIVMLLFTFCVSTILRYSTHQLVLVIADILQLFETNVSIGIPATPFMTVILALVAIETIMSEFFGDSFTAFYVILIVSLCDHYEAIFCRTDVSQRYWPRFFYLYHFAFYAYHYRFNGQFSSLALMVSWLFICHSMIYFFHHYELPNLLSDWGLRDILNQVGHEDHVVGRLQIQIRRNHPWVRTLELIRNGANVTVNETLITGEASTTVQEEAEQSPELPPATQSTPEVACGSGDDTTTERRSVKPPDELPCTSAE